jgi:hypothetical protein
MSKADNSSPPLLEQLGALGSLLIHDMANQMCIISGNATFAQMMLADPAQVGRAVDAILKAGEHLSFILGQCADLRRQVASGLAMSSGTATAQIAHDYLLTQPDWKVEIQGQLEGQIVLPQSWILFALKQIFREIQHSGGEARIRQIRPDQDTAFLPGGTYFETRLTWKSTQAFSIDEIRKRYENLGLLAAFELIRQSGGRLEGFTPASGLQQIILCIPYHFEIPLKNHPETQPVS